jgi:hypothetical protein
MSEFSAEREWLWRTDPQCYWCRRMTVPGAKNCRGGLSGHAATLDHFVPRPHRRKRGERQQYVIACHSCNQRRGSMSAAEWRLVIADSYYAAQKAKYTDNPSHPFGAAAYLKVLRNFDEGEYLRWLATLPQRLLGARGAPQWLLERFEQYGIPYDIEVAA